MARRRFHVPALAEGTIALSDEDAVHARKVLRLNVGDAVELFDGCGAVGQGTITEAGRRLLVNVTELHKAERHGIWLEVATAIPKGDRAGSLVEKAAELGVDRLIPMMSERSVVDPRENKLKRFERIAVEAAKQCEREWVMELGEVRNFADVVKDADHDVKKLADVGKGPAEVIIDQTAQRVLIVVGPEGGWTDGERDLAVAHGFEPWCFSRQVLRIETAVLAAATIVRYRY